MAIEPIKTKEGMKECDYWKKKAKELQDEKDNNEVFSGCLALFLIIIGVILIGLTGAV